MSRIITSRNAGLGNETLYYFRSVSLDPVSGKQRLLIPMVKEQPTPAGYVRCEANTRQELEKISREYEDQKRSDFARVDDLHLARMTAKLTAIRQRLNAKLLSATTSQFERDFIRMALKKLEEGEKNIQPRRIEGCLHMESHEAPLGA